MNDSAPPVIQPVHLPRLSRWPYWVFVPVCALAYNAFCFWFGLEAWGRRGEPKPPWFDVAGVVAFPGLFIPFVGPLVIGGGAGFGLVRLARWILVRLAPIPPRSDRNNRNGR